MLAGDPKSGNGGVQQNALDNALRGHLDDIRAHPPAVTSSDGTVLVEQMQDRPNLVLAIGLGIVIIFSVSLAGVRR